MALLDKVDPQLRRALESLEMPIVHPNDWKPVGGRSLTMAIVFGPTTLRGGLDAGAAANIPAVVGEDRQTVMRHITDSMHADRHFEQEHTSKILMLGMALALSTSGAEAMRRTGLAGVILTYTITPKITPGGYHWRLMVQRSGNTAH
jgi:hypothetical protein